MSMRSHKSCLDHVCHYPKEKSSVTSWVSSGIVIPSEFQKVSQSMAVEAVAQNDVQKLMELAQQGKQSVEQLKGTNFSVPNVNCKELENGSNRSSLTLMHVAAIYDSVDCFAYLHTQIHMALDIPAGHYYTPLHYACYNGSFEVASYILSRQPALAQELPKNIQHHLIYLATVGGNPNCLRLILANGASMEAPENVKDKPISKAIEIQSQRGGDVECLKLLLEYSERSKEATGAQKYTPLMQAIARGHKDAVRMLLDGGEDPTVLTGVQQRRTSALFLACEKGPEWAEQVKMICEKISGANDFEESYKGPCAIHFACKSHSPEILEYVCGLGIDVNRVESEGTAGRTCVYYLLQTQEPSDENILKCLGTLSRYGFSSWTAALYEALCAVKKRVAVLEWLLMRENCDPMAAVGGEVIAQKMKRMKWNKEIMELWERLVKPVEEREAK